MTTTIADLPAVQSILRAIKITVGPVEKILEATGSLCHRRHTCTGLQIQITKRRFDRISSKLTAHTTD